MDRHEKFYNDITVTTHASVYSLMDEILENNNREEDLLELVKLIDRKAENIDFTRLIYEWARDELLRENEISDAVDMSPNLVDAVVELINKVQGGEVVRKVE